jgi:hypothetical protein
VFRYSHHHPETVRPWWEPGECVTEIAETVRGSVLDELDASVPAADLEAHLDSGCSGVIVRAAVLPLPDPPWFPAGRRGSWILFWEDGSGFTVVEHPDRDAAIEAFLAHVVGREAEGSPYDYVVDPGHRRTAWPPGLRPPT